MHRIRLLAGLAACAAPGLVAQRPLHVTDAILAARRTSPELRGAREAVAAAEALERQAAAIANPVLAYGREQTSRAGLKNSQDILQVEQPIELGGQRTARRAVARLRREALEAQQVQLRNQTDGEVVRLFALAVAAADRSRLADRFASVFADAQRVSDQRLAAGDVSGYAARRLRLEGARFAATRAAAALELRHARVALAALMGDGTSSADSLLLPGDLSDVATLLASAAPRADVSVDSLVRLAAAQRPDLRRARLEAAASVAEARVVERSRMPVPTLSAGYKGERSAGVQGAGGGFSGFVAGIAIPLPVFDRRAGALAAASATARASDAGVDALVRRIAREVADAADALRSTEAQRATLAPYMGDEARLSLAAVQALYSEGEISLIEWLDAIRAYQEAQSTYSTLLADAAIRRAVLAQAIGISLFTEPRTPADGAAASPSRKD